MSTTKHSTGSLFPLPVALSTAMQIVAGRPPTRTLRLGRNYGFRSRDLPLSRRPPRRLWPVTDTAIPAGDEALTCLAQWGRTRRILDGAKTSMLVHRRWIALVTVIAAVVTGGIALAAGTGQPSPWQLGLQQSVSPVMDTVVWLHNFLLYIITAIVLFVLALLVYVIVRFNAGSNPVPSKTTHNTLVEVLWTVVPVLILVAIAVPSFQLLFFQLTIPQADLTIKATGKQWFWSYNYPDNGAFEFDSLMIRDDAQLKGQPRLLAVDNEVVVPVNKVVRVQVTAADVIHAFAVPSFGVKIDAV